MKRALRADVVKVADRTHDGRPLKMLTVLDEYSRECLAIVVARRLRADDVLQTLSELFVEHGPPANLRSDNGPEFTAKVVREWLERVEVKTLYIEPGSPWENGYNESFNGDAGRRSPEAGRSSTRWRRRKCSSNSGGGSTTPSDPTARSATDHRPPKRYGPIPSS